MVIFIFPTWTAFVLARGIRTCVYPGVFVGYPQQVIQLMRSFWIGWCHDFKTYTYHLPVY